MEFTLSYLSNLANVRLPKPKGLALTQEDIDMCCGYAETRRCAKDLLSDPNDEITRERLSQLIATLGLN